MKGEDSQFSLGEILAIREYGLGVGDGYGLKNGDGYGFGSRYGDGYGDGFGDGFGCGNGYKNGDGISHSYIEEENSLKFIRGEGEVKFNIKNNLILTREKV